MLLCFWCAISVVVLFFSKYFITSSFFTSTDTLLNTKDIIPHRSFSYKESPLIVIEVLSPSTNQKDRTQKRWDYLSIPTLQEYVLIEQSFVDVEVIRRNQGWRSEHYYMGDNITFESIELSVSVEDIYLHVKNDDVIKFWKKRARKKNSWIAHQKHRSIKTCSLIFY